MAKKDPVRLSKLRQTSQAASAASSFSSWFFDKCYMLINNAVDMVDYVNFIVHGPIIALSGHCSSLISSI